jgi:putative membrane protein
MQLIPELGVPEARHILGLLLTVLATLTSGIGLWRWRQVERAMRMGTSLPRHPTPAYLAVGLCLAGVLVLIVAVVRIASG